MEVVVELRPLGDLPVLFLPPFPVCDRVSSEEVRSVLRSLGPQEVRPFTPPETLVSIRT